MNERYNQVHEHKVPTGYQGRDSPALTGALRRRNTQHHGIKFKEWKLCLKRATVDSAVWKRIPDISDSVCKEMAMSDSDRTSKICLASYYCL